MPAKPTARFYFALIVIISLLLSFGCNPAKQVMKNQAAYDKLINDYLVNHPQRIDTLTELIPGGVDSVFYPVLRVDSVRMNEIKDSLQIVLSDSENDCARAISEAFETGYQQAAYTYKSQKFEKPRPDTIRTKYKDVDYENALKKTSCSTSGATIRTR